MKRNTGTRYTLGRSFGLLATPADVETPLPPGYPTPDDLRDNGWLPIPRQPLPFRSIVAASANDPLARLERVEAMARDWNGEFLAVGEVGHLNGASGFGRWPMALDLLESLDAGRPEG